MRQQRLDTALRQIPGLRLAVLFGSAARGSARRDSDLDLGVALDDGRELSAAAIVDLERAAGTPLDVVTLDAAPPLLRFEIARTGTVLFERDPYAWADFQARAMLDRYAAETRILFSLSLRIAVLGARRAPKRYCQPVAGSAGVSRAGPVTGGTGRQPHNACEPSRSPA